MPRQPPSSSHPIFWLITLEVQNKQGKKRNLFLPSMGRANRAVSLPCTEVIPVSLQASKPCLGRPGSKPACLALSRIVEIPPRTGWGNLAGKRTSAVQSQPLPVPLHISAAFTLLFAFPFPQHSPAVPLTAIPQQAQQTRLQWGLKVTVPNVWVVWALARNTVGKQVQETYSLNQMQDGES